MDNLRGIIFDYGGTLDTNGVHWFHIFRQIYNKYLPQISEKQLREAYVYGERYLATHRVIEPEDDFLAMLKKKIAIQASQLGVEDKGIISKLAVDCNNFVRAHMETTRRVLAALSKRFPMTLVSNFYGNIHTVLRSYGLNGYFKDVVESAIVGVRKPDPRIFSLGIETLGLRPEEVIVIGDSYSKDIVPSHSLGCRTIWLKGQGWSDKDEPTNSSCASHIISELSQVLEII